MTIQNNIDRINRTEDQISLDEAKRYSADAQLMRSTYEAASKTAQTYLLFDGKKTTEGMLEFARMRIADVGASLPQEGKDSVLSEIDRIYSKKIRELA